MDGEAATRETASGADEAGPFRRCALTRIERPVADLIRFVADPGGRIVPDLKGRLPGRGVWVTAARDAVEKAARKGAFPRSLKAAVTADPEIAALVEDLLAADARGAFAIANKAGLVVSGFVKVETLIAKGEAAIVVHASDAAEDGVAKLDRARHARSGRETGPFEIVRELGSDELSLALGRPHVIHAALRAGGASEKFRAAAVRLGRYRTGETAFDTAQGA